MRWNCQVGHCSTICQVCLVPCLFAQSICGIAEQIKTELEEFRVSDILRLRFWAGTDARVSDCTKLLIAYVLPLVSSCLFVFLLEAPGISLLA